jgi:hypothetical protein
MKQRFKCALTGKCLKDWYLRADINWKRILTGLWERRKEYRRRMDPAVFNSDDDTERCDREGIAYS